MIERGCEAVGIDLGTTYSAMAYIDARMTPRMVQDTSGQAVIPSVIFFDDSEVIVGDIALQQARHDSDHAMQFIKLQMGNAWERRIGGETHTPESLSAIILAHLIREAEPQIGSISSAVITVPAYFTEKRRRATQLAGEIAGLQVIGTLNEPMSAALAFGLHQEAEEQVAVVYDLGGGTFDVTVVKVSPDELTELATYGNRELGGRNWDLALVDFLASEFKKKHGVDPRNDPQSLQDMCVICEEAKRRLGKMNQTALRLHSLGHDLTCEVTRAQFEELTAPLLQTTKLTTEMALEDVGIGWDGVSRIVLVGGSTHMPMVRKMLQGVSGKNVDSSVNPVLAVALGAAHYAQLLESGNAPKDVHLNSEGQIAKQQSDANSITVPNESNEAPQFPRVTFVTAHGVGIRASVKGKVRNVVLIHKNRRVPCQTSRTFYTSGQSKSGNRGGIQIKITQGDTEDPELAEVLGVGRLEGIPADEPPGQPVEVVMSFDEQGRLHVKAIYVNSGQELYLELDIPGGLKEERVTQYRLMLQEAGLIKPVYGP